MKPTYCPYCAKPLTAVTETVYRCPNGHEYFNNPVATGSVIFWRDGLALFSKRAIDPGQGKYDFPGGFLEYHEDPAAGAIREILEETGVQLSSKDIQLIAVYPGEYAPYTSVVDLLYLCTAWNGDFQPQDDSEALEWKPIDFVDSEQSNVSGQYPGLAAKINALVKVGDA